MKGNPNVMVHRVSPLILLSQPITLLHITTLMQAQRLLSKTQGQFLSTKAE